jgi:hypothetical protein
MWEGLNNVLRSRLQLVFNHGHFLTSHSFNNYSFLLYSVKSDFIEILYDRRCNTVVWVMKATDHDLKKHLNKIKLDMNELLV